MNVTGQEPIVIAIWIAAAAVTACVFGLPRWTRGLFYTGRHHAHTTEVRPIPLVSIEAKLRREAREAAIGTVWLDIRPDVQPLRVGWHTHIEQFAGVSA